MQGAVTVNKHKFGPIGKGTFGGISGKIASDSDGVRPEFAATELRFASLVTALDSIPQILLSACSSSNKIHENARFVSSFVNIETSRTAIKTLSFWISVVNDFPIGLFFCQSQAEE